MDKGILHKIVLVETGEGAYYYYGRRILASLNIGFLNVSACILEITRKHEVTIKRCPIRLPEDVVWSIFIQID